MRHSWVATSFDAAMAMKSNILVEPVAHHSPHDGDGIQPWRSGRISAESRRFVSPRSYKPVRMNMFGRSLGVCACRNNDPHFLDLSNGVVQQQRYCLPARRSTDRASAAPVNQPSQAYESVCLLLDSDGSRLVFRVGMIAKVHEHPLRRSDSV